MIQKELNEENKEIRAKAYELYEQHGFKNGDDFLDWLEAEKMAGKQSRLKRRKMMTNILYTIMGILCVIVVILLFILFKHSPKMELSEKSLSELKVMMLVLDKKADEEIVALGDTHFDYAKSTVTDEAKALLEKDVQVLKENPKMKIRMAGYTSAQGTEDSNQQLSEKRANAVRSYLIEKGIAPGRISIIGYGRTKPALYEVKPGDVNSEAARANMRVLFEVVVK